MSGINEAPYTLVMHAQDPEFSLLAAKAAVELDNLLLGRQTSLSNVQSLANSLRDSLGKTSPASPHASTVDAGTLGVFGRAIESSFHGQSISMSELVVEAARIAAQLSSSDSQGNKSSLEELRAFCVALSRAAASYRLAIGSDPYDHPFRS